ncbi:MAG: hypothetical protein H7288_12470 [Kineosporiaceae bacterium]|nr:hypothetical protein [Aeromicrobium sp.]
MFSGIERLRVAHHLALKAQHTSVFDAAALARAWPQLAAAAQSAYQTLGSPSATDERIVERISLDALSLALAANTQTWPGKGDSDAALLQVSAAFTSATLTSAVSPIDREDQFEARRLIASSLWSTSRLVGHAARDHSFDVRHTSNGDAPSREAVADLAKDTYRRFNAIEQLSASALGGLGLREGDPGGVGAQLGRAVAGWDVEAHRALLGNRSTAVLHVLSHLEAETGNAVQNLLAQAARANIIDPVTADRLMPVIATSSTSWARLRDASAGLSFANTAVPVRFIDAARNLQGALAATSRLATDEDQPNVLRAVSNYLNSAVTISATARDLIESNELRAPARAISRLLSEHPASHSASLASPVDPIAIYRRQSLPLGTATRRILDEPTRNVFLDAHEAVNRASSLDTFYRRHHPLDSQSDSTSERHAEEFGPTPPQMTASTSRGHPTR